MFKENNKYKVILLVASSLILTLIVSLVFYSSDSKGTSKFNSTILVAQIVKDCNLNKNLDEISDLKIYCIRHKIVTPGRSLEEEILLANSLIGTPGGFYCHGIIHQLTVELYKGEESLVKYLKYFPASCSSSLIHGLFEAAGKNSSFESLLKIAEENCRKVNTLEEQDRFGACWHSFGGAIYIMKNGDVSEAIKACAKLEVGKEVSFCVTGVVQDNVIYAYLTDKEMVVDCSRYKGSVLRGCLVNPTIDRPINELDANIYCQGYAKVEVEQVLCRVGLVNNYLALVRYSLTSVIPLCRDSSSRGYSKGCIRHAVQQITMVTGKEPSLIPELAIFKGEADLFPSKSEVATGASRVIYELF